MVKIGSEAVNNRFGSRVAVVALGVTATIIAPGVVGNVSVKAAPVKGVNVLGLVRVKVRVEVPPARMGDGEKGMLHAIGEGRECLELASEEMSMRQDGQKVDIRWQSPFLKFQMIRFAGGDIDLEGTDDQFHRGVGGRLIGEEKPDPTSDLLWFPAGLEMKLQNEVGSRVERPRHPSGNPGRDPAGLPAQKMPLGSLSAGRCVQALETHLRILFVGAPALGGPVKTNERMVNGPPVAWVKLNRRNMAERWGGHRDDEGSINVRAIGPEHVRFLHLDNQIGGTQLPSFRENRNGRQVTCFTLRRALRHPPIQDGEFLRRQVSTLLEIIDPCVRQPRRHLAALSHLNNLPRMLASFGEAQQREGSYATCMVTRSTMPEKNGGHLAIETRRRRSANRCGREAGG